MRNFDYRIFKEMTWDNEILSYIGQIHEHKGRQNLYLKQKPFELTKLVEIAKIQSTESSNRIENIVTSNVRLKKLFEEKTTPKNRNESEILGYRDVLNTIHENYEYIPLKPSYILQLHRDLYSHSEKTFGGKYKNVQNYIMAVSGGLSYTIFTPLAPYETAPAVEKICENYNEVTALELLDELILIPIFITDFLCIHPFNDGNGRMSRLLTTLLLYRSGYFVGKYVSLEKLIENTKSEYYNALKNVSEQWHEGKNKYQDFIKYFLAILLKAYREFENRVQLVGKKNSAYEKVEKAVSNILGKFSKSKILELCPTLSSSSVESALKKMYEEGKIERIGAGRTTKYVRLD